MSTMYDTIESGWPVYTADDKRVGTVSEVNTRAGYLRLHKGWLFPEDLDVPLDAIAGIDDGSVRLVYTHAEVEDRVWEVAPAPHAGTAGTLRDEPTVIAHTWDETDREDNAALTLRLHEEELVLRTQEVDAGHLGIHKEVVEEPETMTVQVHHEVAHVERVPMDVEYHGADAFLPTEIEIPLLSEKLVVGKRAHVVEEVRVYKKTVTEERQVTERVRKERVSVDEHDTHGRDVVNEDPRDRGGI